VQHQRGVRDVVTPSPLLGTRVVELPGTPKRAARSAVMEFRAVPVLVKPPHARSHLPSVTMPVVLVKEVGGPGDGTDVEWWLMTSLLIDTLEHMLLVIDEYVARWLIEVFFRTLKTGCTVEELRLDIPRAAETDVTGRAGHHVNYCRLVAPPTRRPLGGATRRQ